jgi:hypothetical protein
MVADNDGASGQAQSMEWIGRRETSVGAKPECKSGNGATQEMGAQQSQFAGQ